MQGISLRMIMRTNLISVLLMMLFHSGAASSGLPCALSKTKDGFVCVCNATFCDTIQPVKNNKNNKNIFVHYTTSKAGKVFDMKQGSFNQPGINERGNYYRCQIIINPQERFQEIFGFGGAFTDSAGISIASLSEAAQYTLISCYFGKDGIGYTFGRVPIGGSDFSTHPYTLADQPNDLLLEHFELAPEYYKYKIPYIKMASEMSSEPLLLIGSAWSAPIWMKTNNRITGFGFLKKEYYRLWAEYHIKFLKAYQSEGIGYWAITTGNEPINAYTFLFIPFNSMGWNPRDQGEWVVNHLGPLMIQHFNSCKIITCDDQRPVLPIWSNRLFSVDNVTDFIDGFAVHWYYDGVTPASVLAQVHKKYPEKFLISTEACEGYLPWDKAVILGSWKRGSYYINDIIEDLNNFVSAWVDWNLALDEKGSPNWAKNFVDSVIIVNARRDEFYKQPMFYAMAHFSKFIHPHATRIGYKITACNDVTITVAQNQDDSVVVVIHNSGKLQKNVILKDPIRGTAEVNLDPHSFNSIVYWH